VIKIWDVVAGKPVRTFRGAGDKRIFRLAVSPDRTKLVSRHSIGPIRVWDLATGAEIRKLEPLPFLFADMALMPDGKAVAFSGPAGKIHLVNIETGATSHILEGHPETATAIAVTADGATLVSSGKDRTLKVWDLK